MSSASGSVRSAGARSEASSAALPVIVRGHTRVTSPTPSARLPSRPRSPVHSPVPSRPRSPAPTRSPPRSLIPSPPKSTSKDGPPRRLRYADIRPEPIDPGPRASLALGLSAAQWRHSSQPPPEGYEYGAWVSLHDSLYSRVLRYAHTLACALEFAWSCLSLTHPTFQSPQASKAP